MEKLNQVSNPQLVLEQLERYYGKNIDLYVSTRKNKKYMVEHNGKYIHFGDLNMEDYTKHRDKKRQQLFKTRNAKWKDAPKYSPRALSYYLLW
jgi:hypothetical protein